jgi:hypothetical protein
VVAMKMATEMTEKQRRAVEALEGARSEGVTLSEYAKGHGLVLRELYDAIAALRRKGMLAKPVRKRASGRFQLEFRQEKQNGFSRDSKKKCFDNSSGRRHLKIKQA